MKNKLIIGLGGAGNNVLNHLFLKNYDNLLLISPDKKIINTSSAHKKVFFQKQHNKDFLKSFDSNKETINACIKGIKKICIISSLSGNFATSILGKIIDFLKSKKIQVNSIVYTPFKMEGAKRVEKSTNTLIEIEKKLDSIKVIKLQDMFSDPELGKNDPLIDLFELVHKKTESFIELR